MATDTIAAPATVRRGPLAACLAALRTRLRALRQERYRPERHYMRGPGPMCRRKACSS